MTTLSSRPARSAHKLRAADDVHGSGASPPGRPAHTTHLPPDLHSEWCSNALTVASVLLHLRAQKHTPATSTHTPRLGPALCREASKCDFTPKGEKQPHWQG